MNTETTTNVIQQAQTILEAKQLIKLGARTSLIHALTDLPKQLIASLYPLVEGITQPSGKGPFSEAWYLRSNQRLLHANYVWQLFQQMKQSERGSTAVLIHVYEVYRDIKNPPLLNLHQVYFVPRLVSMGHWYEQACGYCNMSYIAPLMTEGSACPACTEYFHYRCPSCGSAIEYNGIGRNRTICSTCSDKQRRAQKRVSHV